MIQSHFIYLAGADGTGKSTHAQLLLEELQSEGLSCRHLWLRFPFLFSFSLLAYARWRGHAWYEVQDGVRHGYWDFGRSWLMRELFPWILLFDATLAALVRVYLPLWMGTTIVCERYVLDMLVDLRVALADPAFHRGLPGRLFLRLLPRGARIVILDLDARTIRQRRWNLRFDRRLEARLEGYRDLAADLAVRQISTAGSLEQVASELWNFVGSEDGRKGSLLPRI